MPKPTGAEERRRCAALTRAGALCRNTVDGEEALCRVHAAERRAPQSGREKGSELYDDAIGEEERRLWNRISVTDLDSEIRIAKLQLKRLLAAQQRAELDRRSNAGRSAATSKKGKRMGAGTTRTVDHGERVNRLLGRISDLVATRARLQREAEAKGEDRPSESADDPVERLARKIDRVAVRIAGKPGSTKPGPGGASGA